MANPTGQVPATTTPFTNEVTRRPAAATAQTFYTGEMVGLDTSGNVVKCDDTAKVKFDGVQADGINITVDSGDSAGDKHINTQRPRYLTMKIAAAAAGDEGRPVWALYSNEVSYLPNTFANFIGYVHRVVSTTEVEIELATDGPNVVNVSLSYSSPPNSYIFLADRDYALVSINGRVLTAQAFTTDVKKVGNATTIANGTSLLADATNSPYNFNGTANANQALTLTTNAATAKIARGDALALNVNATATNAVGIITIGLIPFAR